jgi:hypothetical protein|tara:strand:- start:1318 stop:1599 length:282 start_codon:yes stop_codon:yes gene_type:complete
MSTDDTTTAVAIAEMAGKFDTIIQNIAAVKEKQEEMAEGIVQIREAVYHPYEGLYARMREIENWKTTSSRVTWILLTALIGIGATAAYATILA